MRTLHLTTFLQGGAGLAIATLAAAQRESGDEVVVVTSATAVDGYGNYESHLQALARSGVPVHAIDSMFSRDHSSTTRVVDFVTAQLGGAARFDVIHAHAAMPSAVALMLNERSCRRTPIIQTMHGWGIAKTDAQIRHDVETLNRVDRVVVPAATSARLLRELGVSGSRIGLVPYGVGPTPPARGDSLLAEMREWRRRGGTVVTCIGTIGVRKNQRGLIEALTYLDDQFLCVCVGDGDAAPVQDAARDAGIEASVRIAGYRHDARRFLAETDVFALPSLSEGQPLAVLEAFCDGAPVAASDRPEISEIVSDGVTGFLFDPEDPRRIAAVLELIRGMAPEARRRLCARARDQYEARFTIDAMVAGYRFEYEAVA